MAARAVELRASAGELLRGGRVRTAVGPAQSIDAARPAQLTKPPRAQLTKPPPQAAATGGGGGAPPPQAGVMSAEAVGSIAKLSSQDRMAAWLASAADPASSSVRQQRLANEPPWSQFTRQCQRF
jgi:hypothetical protein